MFRKMNLIAVLAALLLFSNSVIAQTTVPLNTGYKHSVYNPYPIVNNDPTPVGDTRDNYWINIASYPIIGAAMGPAWILKRVNPTWAPAFANTNWIGARNTAFSPAGTTTDNPAYTIFRKCFCMLPGFKDAKLSFQVRADDTIQVWLNSQVNQVVAPAWGNWNGAPLSGSTGQGFRVGKNCLYVLVEDFHGHMGFDLLGSVTAYGLLPTPAAGTDQSFEPCACRQGPAGLVVGKNNVMGAMRNDDDGQVIQEIVKIAEARRAAKQKNQYQGVPPKLDLSPDRVDPIKRPNN